MLVSMHAEVLFEKGYNDKTILTLTLPELEILLTTITSLQNHKVQLERHAHLNSTQFQRFCFYCKDVLRDCAPHCSKQLLTTANRANRKGEQDEEEQDEEETMKDDDKD